MVIVPDKVTRRPAFKTVECISAGDELLVDYGRRYDRALTRL